MSRDLYDNVLDELPLIGEQLHSRLCLKASPTSHEVSPSNALTHRAREFLETKNLKTVPCPQNSPYKSSNPPNAMSPPSDHFHVITDLAYSPSLLGVYVQEAVLHLDNISAPINLVPNGPPITVPADVVAVLVRQ